MPLPLLAAGAAAGAVVAASHAIPGRAHFVYEADSAERPAVGRNERCPCGSQRKHKICCGR